MRTLQANAPRSRRFLSAGAGNADALAGSAYAPTVDFRIIMVNLVVMVGLYFVLAETYTQFLQPLFSYVGFKNSYSGPRETTSLVLICATASLMPTTFRRPSDLFVTFAAIFTLIPTAVMFTHADLDTQTLVATYLGVAVIYVMRDVPVGIPQVSPVSGAHMLNLLTALAAFGLLATVYRMGLGGVSFGLEDVYDRREVATLRLTGFWAYLTSFALFGNLLASIMCVVFRKYTFFIINTAIALGYFGLSGNKSVIFGTLIFSAYYFVLRSRHAITLSLICIFIPSGYFRYFMMSFDNLQFASFFQQRMMFTPVFLNNIYIEYFKDIDLLWSYSKLSLGTADYTLAFEPTTMVGYYLTGGNSMHANTGFIGSGYMNAGFTGIFLYALIIGYCCRAIDVFAQRRGSKVFSTLICLPGFLTAVTTSDVPYVLFSGGWGIAIFLAASFDPSKSEN